MKAAPSLMTMTRTHPDQSLPGDVVAEAEELKHPPPRQEGEEQRGDGGPRLHLLPPQLLRSGLKVPLLPPE